MSVQDLPSLHRRYVELAGRFKAAWTFHQFLQGIQKFFAEASIPQYPTELAEIHATLKQVSESLTGNDPAAGLALLERAGVQLEQTLAVLSATDARVTPPLVRQFFERVKSYDDQILAQMVRFYLTLSAEEGLSGDRLDKVDFLLTKLGEETDPVSGSAVIRDRARLRSIFEGFWSGLDGLTADSAWIEERRVEIGTFRREVAATDDLGAFTERQLIRRYREAKRLLGRYLFHPDLLLAVVETNLAIKNKLRQSFRDEEQRILGESQRMLAVAEGYAPSPAVPDVSQLRRAYDEVERKKGSDNLKLEDLAFLRREVDELRPRLLAKLPDEIAEGAAERESEAATPEAMLAPHLRELLAALEATDDRVPPKEAALSRELFHLRLEAREVIAFRRLHVEPAGDAGIERLLFEAAALRHRVAAEATEISEVLDETQVTRDSPLFERARRTTQLAEDYVQRLGQLIDEAVKAGSFGEVQQLQLLRMRLIRDYSGLWLLVSRPTG